MRHMHEPQYLWERYVEPKYRDQVPKVAFMDGNFMVYEPDGKFISKGEIQAAPPESARRAMAEKYGEAYRQWWSAEIRLKDMDRLGWDIQILLPTGNNGNFAYRVALKDLQLGAAMCRAYNNWCHDYCSTDPKRLKFVAVLPGLGCRRNGQRGAPRRRTSWARCRAQPISTGWQMAARSGIPGVVESCLRVGFPIAAMARIANAASNRSASWKATATMTWSSLCAD